MNDPARLIWGDAVIDEAQRVNDSSWHGGGAGYTAGWVHKTGESSGVCCIVGHLNWIAAEQAGIDPEEAGIGPWPGVHEAMADLCTINPTTPTTIPINGIPVDTIDVIAWMINDHDGHPRIGRKNAGWWGEKLTQRIVRRSGLAPWNQLPAATPLTPAPPPVEDVVVEEAVPVLVAR